MLLEKLETVKPVKRSAITTFRVIALYAIGTVALIATVVFVLQSDEPADFPQQFGIIDAGS
jgi:hypothetical protein